MNAAAAFNSRPSPLLPIARLGVLIRFQNSATTLPAVLTALHGQTLQPDVVVGIDSGSNDGSPAILAEAGARIFRWEESYHHSRVLNFGLALCPAERVLVLSSHTVLNSADALERLNAALDDPRVACASSPWDDDAFYSDAIDWGELSRKGLKLGSFYSNSAGLLRRRLWEQMPFDESLPTMEDYAWAIAQIRRGYVCRRVRFAFHHLRRANARDFIFTACAFRLAARHGLRVRWLGRKATAREWLRYTLARLSHRLSASERELWELHRARFLGSLLWPFHHATTDRPPAARA